MEVIRIVETILATAMREGQDLIQLANNNPESSDNPCYRALIQTPRVIDYSNVGLPSFEYTEEAIKEAIGGLIGSQIEDEAHHSGGDRSFATIYNADYNPEYGAYVDFEVFREEYKPVFRNIYKNLENGVIPKKKFSTEVTAQEVREEGDKYQIIRMDYDGLVWTKYPRDPDTGLCHVNLNNNFKGDDILTDKNKSDEMIPKAEYTELESKYNNVKQELEDLKAKYQDGEASYNEGKGLYETLQDKYKKLKDNYNDAKTKLDDYIQTETKETETLTNSIIESYPEAERESVKETLQGMGLSQLRLFNSHPGREQGLDNSGKGATSKPGNKKDKLSDEEKQAVELLNSRKRRKEVKSIVKM